MAIIFIVLFISVKSPQPWPGQAARAAEVVGGGARHRGRADTGARDGAEAAS